jgi:hypothetical protein
VLRVANVLALWRVNSAHPGNRARMDGIGLNLAGRAGVL